MPSVKCVHCETENDPVETAGYCDSCGKKLPGIYVPSKPAFPAKDESAAEQTSPGPGRRGLPSIISILMGTVALLFALAVPLSFVMGRGIFVLLLPVAALFGFMVCLLGVFASREQLLEMSHLIGTKNPTTARRVCFVGLFVFLLGMIMAGAWVLDVWSQLRK